MARTACRRAGAGLRRASLAGLALLLPALTSCELEEVTLVEPEDVVVAEAHLQLVQPLGQGGRLTVFLHRTLGPGGESRPVDGARVAVTRRGDGVSLELARAPLEVCVVTTPVDGTGSCYWAPPSAVVFGPGDTLELRVDLPDGGVMESLSVVPGTFSLPGLEAGVCRVAPGTQVGLSWTASEGAWAYVSETVIRNLTEALAPAGITVDPEDDPLYLLGLSVSASDTTIAFPGEFGLFERFELDQEVALALQEGLPPPAEAEITIAAADRNYVNWVRGGNFNPSGAVRVPSVGGDGTGVFGSSVIREVRVVAVPPGDSYAAPVCPEA